MKYLATFLLGCLSTAGVVYAAHASAGGFIGIGLVLGTAGTYLARKLFMQREGRVHRRRPHGPRRATVANSATVEPQVEQTPRRRCAPPSNPRRAALPVPTADEADVIAALVGYGLKITESRKVVAEVSRPGLTFNELFKAAVLRITAPSTRSV